RGRRRGGSPPPRRLRRPTGTRRLRRGTPKRRGDGAGHGTPWPKGLGALAPPVADVPAPHVRGVGGGIPTAGLLGPRLCAAATRQRPGAPGGRARLSLPMEPPPLAVLAGASAGRCIRVSPSAQTP